MLFLFRSAPEVEKRIHSKLFRKFWRSRGTKEPAYITVTLSDFCLEKPLPLSSVKGAVDPPGGKQGLKLGPISDSWQFGRNQAISQSLTMWCKKNKQSVV